jgi:sigma-54 dependent transcriptional regulator, acetoin dehydrogenase operon transcriptional activator AcoR
MKHGASLVVKDFADFNYLDHMLEQNWERFHSTGDIPNKHRSVILSSWDRCKHKNVDPLKKEAELIISDNFINNTLEQNQLLLNFAKPFIDELFQYFSNQNIFVSLCDSNGIIIETKANKSMLKKLERQHFVPGADWSEQAAGTNAFGTALLENKPLQIFSSEHYCQGWHPYVCSSAPIHDPITNQVIGVLDMSGEKQIVQAHDLHFVISQAQKIEQALRMYLMKDAYMPFQTLFGAIHEPIIIFDLKGKVIMLNESAKYLLQISEGMFITDYFDQSLKHQFQSTNDFFQINGYQKDGTMWNVKIHPYKIGNQFLGGFAVFHPYSSKVSAGKKFTTRYDFNEVISNNKTMLSIMEQAKKAAFSMRNLLILGETGTGKEVLVQSIHSFGPRKMKPFVAVNCGAIPKELIASELFGYEGGAFTGAKLGGSKGKFLLADKGTIFLDEIAELPLDLQVYLLRILEEREFVPIGGKEAIPIDVRVICATHKNLQEEVRKGNFREDLYYRLNVISLTLPPLRERMEDIPLLIEKFLSQESRTLEVSDQAMEVILQYDWPGNIRQLKNCIEQASFKADTSIIQLEDLPDEVRGTIVKSGASKKITIKPAKIEKETLVKILQETGGNVTKTSKILNISRMTVYRKIGEFNLEDYIKK